MIVFLFIYGFAGGFFQQFFKSGFIYICDGRKIDIIGCTNIFNTFLNRVGGCENSIFKFGFFFEKKLVVLVLDFGTATTYDLVTEEGNFAAGITAPGIRISSEALWSQAAKLPKIEIQKPKSILAQETISSMQAGLVYGQIGQTEYIIRKVKEESGLADLKVVATGGLGRLISDETETIDVYDSALTLDGLRIIYEKNRKDK